MNQKKLLLLAGVVVVLGIAFYFSGSDAPGGAPAVRQLFADVDGEKIVRIKIEKGAEAVQLELKDSAWGLPSRAGYRADSAKVRSLLLKLFELGVTQKLPNNADSFAALGVADTSVANGSTKVSFEDADGKEVASLILGDSRKSKKPQGPGYSPSGGQYLRRGGSPDVYLVSEGITAPVESAGWLSTELVNVAQAHVRRVRQYRQADTGEVLEFEVERKDGAPPTFVPAAAFATGEEVQEAVLSQLGSGLENARLSDVLPAAEAGARLKDAVFDARTEYWISNGLVYSVATSAAGEKGYLKISARFDPELAKAIEAEVGARNEELKREFEAKQAGSSTAGSSSEAAGAASAAESSSAEAAAPQLIKLELAKAEDSAKFNQIHGEWVYEVAKYLVDRFRHTKSDLFKAKSASSSSSEMPAANEGEE